MDEIKELMSATKPFKVQEIESTSKCVTNEEIKQISSKITREQHRPLARALGLTKAKMEEIERNCTVNQYGDTEIVCQMLEKWKEKNGREAKAEILVSILLEIGRTDIVDETFREYHCRGYYSQQDLKKELKERQQDQFRDLILPRSLWLRKKWLPMEELFVEPLIRVKNTKGVEEDRPIDQKEIFDKIENRIPRRILIEGHPGYGKTTLVTKFLSDWSRDEKYLKDKFDFVFVIPLRNYKGEIEHHLLRQCEGVKGNEEEILQLIAAAEDRVLLLLDGLDECDEKFKDQLISLIKGDEHKNMTVVVTCRSGLFYLNVDTKRNFRFMGNKDFEMFSVWDKRVQIKGISNEKRTEFLRKYLNVEITELDKKLEQSKLKLSEFYECPLFLLLLAVLLQEKKVKFTESKTELYKTIFNFVINRSLEKVKGNDKEVDLFDEKILDEFNYRNLLIDFGRLCLEKLKSQMLIFEETELLKCSGGNEIIFKLGILSKQISFSNHEDKNCYEPIHKSFLEFLSAFYLSSLDENEMKNEIKELLLEFDIWPQEDQLLYSFLGGFLQSNAFKMFNALSPYSSLISVFDNDYQYRYTLNQILLEIPETSDILNSLSNFSPGNWERSATRKKYLVTSWVVGFLKVIYQNRTNQDISFRIPDDTEILNSLPEEFCVDKIFVNFSIEFPELKLKRNTIQCKHLVIESSFHFFSSNWKELMKKVKAEKIWLKTDGEDFLRFYELMIKGDLKQLNVSYWTFSSGYPYPLENVPPLMQNLIKHEKIQHGVDARMEMAFDHKPVRTAFESLAESVADSQLSDFRLTFNEPFCLPTNIFNRTKKWKVLDLRGRKFSIYYSNSIESFSVEHFRCSGLTLDEHYGLFSLRIRDGLPHLLLKCKDIKRLSCSYDLISNLVTCENFSSWKGFQTIEHLELVVDRDIPIKDDSFLRVVSLFKNIRELGMFYEKYDQQPFLVDFILHLPSLKKLFYFFKAADLNKFFEGLLDFVNQNKEQKLTLDEIEIQLKGFMHFSPVELADCLTKCFLKRIFHKFSLLDAGWFEDIPPLIKCFFDKDGFVTSSHLVECLDEWNAFPKLRQKLSITYVPENTN